MDDASLEQVQSKIAYLEHSITELSDVVFRQHKQLQALESQLQLLKEKLDGQRADDAGRSVEQERPPHY